MINWIHFRSDEEAGVDSSSSTIRIQTLCFYLWRKNIYIYIYSKVELLRRHLKNLSWERNTSGISSLSRQGEASDQTTEKKKEKKKRTASSFLKVKLTLENKSGEGCSKTNSNSREQHCHEVLSEKSSDTDNSCSHQKQTNKKALYVFL